MTTSTMANCDLCGHTAHLIDGVCATCRATHRIGAHAIDADRLLEVLADHIGASNGVSMHDLAIECMGINARLEKSESDGMHRSIRKLVEELRLKGHHICAHPATGYYIAENAEELQGTCAFLHERAMKTLRQVSAMTHVSLPDLVGQERLRLEVQS